VLDVLVVPSVAPLAQLAHRLAHRIGGDAAEPLELVGDFLSRLAQPLGLHVDIAFGHARADTEIDQAFQREMRDVAAFGNRDVGAPQIVRRKFQTRIWRHRLPRLLADQGDQRSVGGASRRRKDFFP
jgi:hypothetical protein